MTIAACHEQPSLVRRDTVATEEDCLLRVEENMVGLCADEWTRAGKRGIGREDKRRSKELSARIRLCERQRGGEEGEAKKYMYM